MKKWVKILLIVLLAVVLLICFLLRRQAHRVRAALDLSLCILLLIGGVVLTVLGLLRELVKK